MLLTGCGAEKGDPVQEALDFRTAVLAAETCSFQAEVSADFGDRVYEFALDCAYHPQENDAELTVTAPESLAGICATVDGETASVTYEDVSLELGTMAGGHVAPMQLPQLLGDAWAYGYIESQAREGDGFLLTYRTGYDQEELMVRTVLNGERTPVQAEVYYDGVCVLTAEISEYLAQ